jgi:hypothetical protein
VVRTVLIGVISLVAVVAVLGTVFAVGVLRIRLANTGAASVQIAHNPSTAPATQPSTRVEQDLEVDPDSQYTELKPPHSIDLPADKATLSSGLKLERCNTPPPPKSRDRHRRPPDDTKASPAPLYIITGWRRFDDMAEWAVSLPKEGNYEVDVVYASAGHVGASVAYAVSVGDKELTGQASAEPGGRQSYQMATVGTISFPAGKLKVRFRLTEVPKKGNLALRGVRLIPAS